MKFVVSGSEVIHFWANQVQSSARSPNGSVFFSGASIFSYGNHYALGVHCDGSQNKQVPGKHFTLINDKRYSSTTAKHQHDVRAATRHLNVIHVPDLNNLAMTLPLWSAELTNLEGKFKRARKKERILSDIRAVGTLVNRYVAVFGIHDHLTPEMVRIIGLPDLPVNIEVCRVALVESDAANIERERFYLLPYEEREVIYKLRRETERDRARERDNKAIQRFRDFKNSNIIYSSHTDYHLRTDLLRYNPVSECVETSQGVKVGLNAAYSLYSDLIRFKSIGMPGNYQVDHRYNLSEVNNEFIRVGCHRITWIEIEAIMPFLEAAYFLSQVEIF